MTLLLLALDASTPVITVGVARVDEGVSGSGASSGRELLAEINLPGAGASEALLGGVRATLDLCGEDLSEVGRILVGTGPGTFTGIRIAAATARSLALATGAGLTVNSTLAALAAPALDVAPDVLAVLDARRRQVFARAFAGESGAVVPVGESLCVEPGELSAAGSPLLVGDGAVRYREILSGVGVIPPDASPLHRVTASGHVRSAGLEVVRAREVVPEYVREPDAEVRRDLNPWLKP